MASPDSSEDHELEIIAPDYRGPDRRARVLPIFPWYQIGYFIMGVGVIIALGLAASNYGQTRDQANDNQATLTRLARDNHRLQLIALANCNHNLKQDQAMRTFLRSLEKTRALQQAPEVLGTIQSTYDLFDPKISGCPDK